MADKRSTPDEVEIRMSPREPETDPKLGIEVAPVAARPAKHRLVTVGDSLTHGFMSGAIHRTDLSWPAITAFELGLTPEQFTFPTYEWPTGPGGLPLDLERFARSFEQRFGAHLDFREIVSAGLWIRKYMDGSRTSGSGATATLPRPTDRRSTTPRSTAGTRSTRSCSPRPGSRPSWRRSRTTTWSRSSWSTTRPAPPGRSSTGRAAPTGPCSMPLPT